ncbi:MAG: UvrD-helicase domain-containing protein [Bdellovibrionota bacterium]
MIDLETAPSIREPGFLSSLNERQREAVQITEGPLIVLAGAGSGKTKMLTSRIAYLIEAKKVSPQSILAMTFTNKAAGEMRERVERTLGHSAQQGGGHAFLGAPEIGTFHAVCVRILRREGDRLPFTKPFVIYDDSDQLSLLKGVMNKLNIDDKAFNPKAFQGAINRAKCEALEAQEMSPSAHNIFEKQVKRVYEQYQRDLFDNNAIDFGEIICMTYRLFRDHLDIRQKYQRRFRYIHVDEYQDTNRAQYLLLSMLANPKFGGHQNICVVGDEDQSIYKWRGADIKNILDFESDYPGAQVVKLEQNYRSTKTIIKAAGHVIRNNRSRKDKTLWTDNQDGTSLVRFQLPDERAEAEVVVSEIKRLAEHEGRSYTDFAVFYRTNAQSRQFEDILRREKIPYQIVGGLRFYDRKEIKDILAYFKVILNPTDSINLKRIINTPVRGIGKTTVEKLDNIYVQLATDGILGQGELLPIAGGYWQALEAAASDGSLTSPATARKLATFVLMMKKMIAAQPRLLLSELFHLILDETGYVKELRSEGTEESLSRVQNLEEFDALLQEFEEDQFEQIIESDRELKKKDLLPIFLEQSALASDLDSLDSGGVLGSSVKLMTLHSSKGLEFPVVFMVGMEEGLFPSIKHWEDVVEEDVEEERRLCYVGMTRAREQLYLLSVSIRRIWGNAGFQEPSRFFTEIPDEFVQVRDLTQGSRGFGQIQYRLGSSRQFGYTSNSAPERNLHVVSSSSNLGSSSLQGPSKEMIGRRIHHPEYGLGTILSSESSGEDLKVIVEFRTREKRKFLWRYIASLVE